MNFQKSLLSVAAATVLSTAAIADSSAVYVPLTNTSNDYAWIMFGVNDFSNGVASAASTGIFTAGYSEATETSTSDTLATSGFPDSGAKNMASFQALLDSNGAAYFTGGLKMAMKSDDLLFSETEPIRTMFIAIEGADSTAKIQLNYKASLEGREVEIEANGDGIILRTTINQKATFTNPAVARNVPPAGSTNPDLTKVDDVLAYDLTASPVIPSFYSKADHQGSAVGVERFYNYDSINQRWNVWDRAKTGTVANDFTDFEKGKAYWGRMSVDTAAVDQVDPSNSASAAGLVLGKTSNVEANASVYSGKLAEGWNMLSFDKATHADIRNAATGMILNFNGAAAGDTISITDETGVNSVTITLSGAASEGWAVNINQQIDAAKLNGDVPKSFNVKAFAADATDTNLILVSDKKFTVKDGAGASITTATTLTGGSVWDEATNALVDYSGGNVPVTGVTSVYGEYAMVVEPLTSGVAALDKSVQTAIGDGVGTALSAAVQFGNVDGDSLNGNLSVTPLGLAPNDTVPTVTTADTALSADDVFDGTKSNGQIVELDSNFDGTTDMLLMAADKPFYVKDNTFTRVYELNVGASGTGTGAVAFTVANTVSGTVTPTGGDNIAAVITKINTLADAGTATTDTKTYATSDGTKLIVATTDSKVFDLRDAASSTIDYFTKSSSTNDLAKGAIKRVLNIAELARQDVTTNKWEIAFTGEPTTAATDGATADTFTINGTATTVGDIVYDLSANTDTERLRLADEIVSKINAALKSAGLAALATHDYVSGALVGTKITVEGVGITALAATEDDTATAFGAAADANAATAGKIDLDGAAIVSDLKANAVYTPDYANYGPLYTLKDAGYKATAMIHPSTALATSPSTHWDTIDLTDGSSEWLKDNKYNLFSVDNYSGYWVYLEPYTDTGTITVSNVVYTPTFTHHFNINNSTENIISGGTFSAEIAGVSEATSNVKLIIGGNEVQLTKSGDTYSANLTEYETSGITSGLGSPISIGIRAADGLGEAFYDSAITTLDYDKPAAPTVTFSNGIEATFADTSSDVTSYYIYEDYIPEDYTSPVKADLLAADASAYNMCHDFAYGSSHNLKLIALDGLGKLTQANASDAKAFTYVNILKSALTVTHTFGEALSSSVEYNSTCELQSTATDGGVDVQALTAGTVRMSFQPVSVALDATTDLPWTIFYDIAGSGTAVIKVTAIPLYAGKKFYVEYNGALYSGTFSANRTAADATASTPAILTAVTAENQTLVNP